MICSNTQILTPVSYTHLDVYKRQGELGKVDGGGGGTIAKYVANMNVDVVDLGLSLIHI